MSETQSLTTNKRRPRILAIQKKNLVSLVQNYFIRTVGHHNNANFDEISLVNWNRIASILNTMGPVKNGKEWKSTFYYMKNRIRKKLALVRQFDAIPSDNLSELDLKIHEMMPAEEHNGQFDFNDLHWDNPNANEAYSVDFQGQEYNNDHHSEEISGQEHTIKDSGPEVIGVRNSTLVVRTPEELERYMESIIEEDGAIINDNIEERNPKFVTDAEIDEYSDESTILLEEPRVHMNTYETKNEPAPALDLSEESDAIDIIQCPTVQNSQNNPSASHSFMRREPSVVITGNQRGVEGQSSPNMAPRSVQLSKSSGTGKVSTRIPAEQKERLVQLIQNNFLKAVGPFAASNGSAMKAQLWQRFAKELNKLGPPRTADQWKTTFNAIKSSAKAKLADCHNNVSDPVPKNLKGLEEKIVSMCGMDSMDGHQNLGESGFRYEKTVPVARQLESEYFNSASEGHESDAEQNPSNEEYDGEGERNPSNEQNDGEGERNPSNEENDDDAERNLSEEDLAATVLWDIIQEIRAAPDHNVNEGNVSMPLHRTANSMRSTPVISDSTVDSHPAANSRLVANSRPVDTSRLVVNSRSAAVSGPITGNAQAPTGIVLPGRANASRRVGTSGKVGTSGRLEAENRVSGRGAFGRMLDRASERNMRNSRSNQSNSNRRGIFAPQRRNGRGSSEIGYITNINQFFIDGGDEDEVLDEGQQNRVEKPARDRSNLRNKHTSYEMVQRSMEAQEQFFEDSNRNHSEMMFLNDRNHLESVGMFTSTLRAFTDVAREFVNKM